MAEPRLLTELAEEFGPNDLLSSEGAVCPHCGEEDDIVQYFAEEFGRFVCRECGKAYLYRKSAVWFFATALPADYPTLRKSGE